jgi:hypothetical protein
VFNAISGHTSGNVSVTLMPRSMVTNGEMALAAEVWNKEGRFEVRGVFPGSYIISAWWSSNQEHYSARRELEVGNTDLEGANLTITRGVDVPGHIAWEEKPPSELQSVHVALQALDEGPYSPNSGAYDVKPDGSFVIKNVPEGVYRPHVFTGSWDCFLKSARYASADVTEGGVAVHAGIDASLELTMSSRAARIEGVVVTADLVPAAGVYVVAVPNAPRRDQEWKYGQELTDQNGKFLLRGIVPGDYRIFSWTSADEFDWHDQEQLKPYESKGVPLSVQEGDRKTVQLTVNETKNASQGRQ